MAVDIIDPNRWYLNSNWNIGSTNISAMSDDSDATYIPTTEDLSHYLVVEFELVTSAAVTITNISITVRCIEVGIGTNQVGSPWVNAAYLSEKSFDAGSSYANKTQSWSGNWTLGQVNNGTQGMRFRIDSSTTSKSALRISEITATITYASGYQATINGVVNPSEINDVDAADISAWNGVE